MPLALLAIALASGAPPAIAPPEPARKPKLICREAGRALTGTRIRSARRCKTAEQWLKEDAELDKIPATMRITKGQGDGLQGARNPAQ